MFTDICSVVLQILYEIIRRIARRIYFISCANLSMPWYWNWHVTTNHTKIRSDNSWYLLIRDIKLCARTNRLDTGVSNVTIYQILDFPTFNISAVALRWTSIWHLNITEVKKHLHIFTSVHQPVIKRNSCKVNQRKLNESWLTTWIYRYIFIMIFISSKLNITRQWPGASSGQNEERWETFKKAIYNSQYRFAQTRDKQFTWIEWLIRDLCMEGLEEEATVSINSVEGMSAELQSIRWP